MEQTFTLSTGHVLFIQDCSTQGGFEFSVYSPISLIELDGGWLETGKDEWATDISDTIVKLVLNVLIPGNPNFKNVDLNKVSWQVNEDIDRDVLSDAETKDMFAGHLLVKYFNHEFDLETLHNKLVSIFGSIKTAFYWLADSYDMPKYRSN